jgi:eukaryotic-like serine/threonine-protein kinase
VTPERWRQVNALFHAAVDRAPAERQALLDDTARSDPALAADVRSLLDAHDSGEWLERPAWALAPELMVDPAPALQPGSQAGPYRIEREIGRGGMGIVYEAEDTRLRRRVALKALPAPYARDPIRRERLTREARAAAALAHPNIATVHALDEIDGTLYLVSELVRGETLRDEIRRGPLAAGRLRATLAELSGGLAAAHAAGIVHRDFKPENLIRCADGRVKILDFGLARTTDPAAVTEQALTEAGVALGTPGYMAPEQLAGGHVDARADVFAFGVVAWELSTGVHPFGTSPAELLGRVTDAVGGRLLPTDGARIPIGGLDRILRRCLARDPADRYPSAVELSGALAQLETAVEPAHRAPPDRALFWWQFHQVCLAVVVAAMPVACWFVRRHEALVGSIVFLGVLALATVAVAIRLNLLFTSRAHPHRVGAQQAHARGTLVAVEGTLALILTIAAALVAGENDPLAAVLVGLAAGAVVSLAFIEPATTSAAMGEEA